MNRLNYLALISSIALSGACEGKVGQDASQVGGAQSVAAVPVSVGGSGGASSTVGTDLSMYCNGLLAGQTCAQTGVPQIGRNVNMLLVIDESGSMNQPNPTTVASKWVLLGQALASTLGSFANEVDFGLLLFPYDPAGIDISSPVSSCNVPSGADAINVDIAPGAANEEAIVDYVRSQTPAGGTPTSKALQQAYTYFTQGNGKDLIGTKWVILVTDGGPNCNGALRCTAYTCTTNMIGQCGSGPGTTLNCCDEAASANANLGCLDDLATVSQIENLKAAGVQTFVVGLPGSEPLATTLDAMAQVGGVPNQNGANGESFYAVSASNYLQDLSDDLTQILTPLVRHCDIPLYFTPAVASRVHVVVDCALLPQVPVGSPADAGVDGFYVDYSQTQTRVRIVGAPCNDIMTKGAQHVDVIEACALVN